MPNPAPTQLTPGSQTSENALTKLVAVGGLVMIAAGTIIDMAHPMGNLGADLRQNGLLLAGGSTVIYGGFRTVLKWVNLAKSYEPIINAAAQVIPGAAGDAARHYLPIVETLADKLLQAQPPANPAPPSPAQVALQTANTAPVAPQGSPNLTSGA